MKRTLVPALLPVLIASSLGSAHAVGLDINGFLTAGVTTHNQSGADYYGVTDGLDFGHGSVFGLQFSSELSERGSITGQLIADGKNDFDIEAEWAYASLNLLPQLDVRAGRLRTPLYLMSDFMDVGYAYTWATLPDAVYTQNRVTNFDGIDAIYSADLGSVFFTAQPFFGASKFDYGAGVIVNLEDAYGVNVSANYNGLLTLRGGVNKAKVTLENEDLAALAAGAAGAGLTELVDELTLDDSDGLFTTLGVQLDLDSFSFVSEYANRQLDGALPDLTGYYTSFIYRGLSSFTPYVTWADVKTKDEKLAAMVPGQGASGNASLDGLHGLVAGFEAQRKFTQQSIALGARYDYSYNTAFKVEWKRILPKDDSMGGFEGIAQSELKEAVDLLTLNATIVF